MKKAVQDKDRRLYLLGGQLYSAAGIGSWCFDKDQYLFYSTAPHWEEFQTMLRLSGVLDRMTMEESDDPIPWVRSDELGLQWITERVNTLDGGEMFIVVGPMFLQNMSKEMLMQKLADLQLSLSTQFRYRKLLGDIPVVDQAVLGALYRVLHYTIYDEYLGPSEIHFEGAGESQSLEKTGRTAETEEEGSRSFAQEKNVSNNYARMAEVEKTLLDCVRTGTYEERGRDSTLKTSYNGELQDFGLSDGMRTAKDNIIIFVDKCMWAAVEGGLPVQAARDIENEAVCRIEGCRRYSDLANVNWDTFLRYVNGVHESKKAADGGISQPIQTTLNYILQNYRKEITLADLAKNANYTEYYLSRKFTKETGYKIQDYIKEVRINSAKVELLTSEKSINDIALGLQFKSRSHFDRNFTAIVGTTPAQYRNRASKNMSRESSKG